MEEDDREGKGKGLDGRIRVRYKSQQLTELVGGVVLRPYVPHGTKWIGEEGKLASLLSNHGKLGSWIWSS